MLYLIGLGLGNPRDVTLKGSDAIQQSDVVYLEVYTSILAGGPTTSDLETFYKKTILPADREFIEQNSDSMLEDAKTKQVSLLVVGDPFGATTHSDLVLRAREMGVQVQVIHNASIMNAIGCCGLQLYNFGETVSIVMWTDSWKPDSYYPKIVQNRARGLHTLCLLDIKVKEQSVESMMKKTPVYDPPRYMTAAEAAAQLLEISHGRPDEQGGLSDSSVSVGLARVGWDNQKILACSLGEMATADLGPPLHSLIITGHLHPLEESMLDMWKST